MIKSFARRTNTIARRFGFGFGSFFSLSFGARGRAYRSVWSLASSQKFLLAVVVVILCAQHSHNKFICLVVIVAVVARKKEKKENGKKE